MISIVLRFSHPIQHQLGVQSFLLELFELVCRVLILRAKRTAPPGLIARIVAGSFAGATLAMACGQGLARGAILGIGGALVGTFGGYHIRRRLVKALGTWDQSPLADRVGMVEDLVALGGSFWLLSRFARF